MYTKSKRAVVCDKPRKVIVVEHVPHADSSEFQGVSKFQNVSEIYSTKPV